jgi:hypothetical protein
MACLSAKASWCFVHPQVTHWMPEDRAKVADFKEPQITKQKRNGVRSMAYHMAMAYPLICLDGMNPMWIITDCGSHWNPLDLWKTKVASCCYAPLVESWEHSCSKGTSAVSSLPNFLFLSILILSQNRWDNLQESL